MDDSEQTLTGAELDLARLTGVLGGDGFLQDLLKSAADTGFGFGVGILANGMIITGQLTSSRLMAEALDRQQANFAAAAEHDGDPPDNWDELVAAYSTKFTRQVDALAEDARKIDADFDAHVTGDEPVGLEDLPESLARRILATEARGNVTLRDARILAPGQAGQTRLPVLRLALHQITGWWVLDADETGSSHVTLWETIPED